MVHYRERRGGREVFVCTIADDAGVVIPAWMFDRDLCSRMRVGGRRASVAALREVRSFLDELHAAAAAAASGTLGSEESDAETKLRTEPTDAARPAAVARILDDRR